jgi:photosystem II stability/assembly factor-like uncharacterized protein
MTGSLSFRSVGCFFLGGLVLVGLVLLLFVFAIDRDETPRTTALATWTPPIQVASGDAYRGPWRMNDSDWRFVDDPTVALGHNGTAGVVWTNHPEQDLFFQAYGPDGTPRLETPTNVSQTPDTFSWLPRLLFPTGDADTVYVLWQEIIFSGGSHGGEILFARSTDGGRTFSEPSNLSQSIAGDGKGRLTSEVWHNGSLDLAVGPEGTLYTAWTEYEGRLWLRHSADGGRHFSDPVHVTGTSERPARAPSLAVAPSGTVHLAWTVGQDPAADIRYTRTGSAGDSLSSPQVVAPSDGHSDAPKLAVDDGGTVHLAYGERPAGPSRPSHIRYTRATPDSAFKPTRVLSRRSADTYESAAFPYLQAGPNDTLYVMWELSPTAQERPRAFGITASSDGGTTFDRIGADAIGPEMITAVAIGDRSPDEIWVGTEPSRVYRSTDAGETWSKKPGLTDLPSASEWSYPPRPHTHHVRWIEPDPYDADHLYVSIEAGALVQSHDGGATWEDRRPTARRDVHSMTTHPEAPGYAWVAAGDGYAETRDGGASWIKPQEGLDHRYCWSVAVDSDDPTCVLVSAAHGSRSAHAPTAADSYVYRRRGGSWQRLDDCGLTMGDGVVRAALAAGHTGGVFYAATNRGLYRTADHGESWDRVDIPWDDSLTEQTPRGLAVVPE